MKVLFRGVGAYDRPIAQGADALREGHEYVVLEVFAAADGRNMFRVEVSSDELPPLFDSRLFEVTDGSIPACWCLFVGMRGDIVMGPEEWETNPDFWDSYIDGEPWAVALYQSGKEKSLG
ncbi:hypothetical protein ACF052_33000 [Streptomyces pilosus]|uniref:hypothetical protein n=1 Tax=Streptomyces pilosus TaxID=28893 RepID=UPI0036FF8E0D